MSNTLLQDQNKDQYLRLLCAQREAYRRAKKVQVIDFISLLIALFPTVLLFIDLGVDEKGNNINRQTLSLVAVIGVFWTVGSVFAQMWMDKQTKLGATIQDKFDTKLFNLESNAVLIDSHIDTSKIIELGRKYNKEDMKNWYSINIPPTVHNDASVLLAYLCNGIFGKSQRNNYIGFIALLIFLYYGGFIVYSLIENVGIFDFTLFIAPSIPALIYASITIQAQWSIIKTYEKIITLAEKKYLDYKINDELPTKQELRQIQDLFYTQRLVSNKIPTWFYRIMKGRAENLVDDSIKALTTD
jgi:hypothetical protein